MSALQACLPLIVVCGFLAEVQAQNTSRVLVCAAIDIDVLVSGEIALCVDRTGRRYHMTAFGGGLSFGLSVTVYGVALRSANATRIEGRYRGIRAGSAVGALGLNAGVFAKIDTEGFAQSDDRLYLLGYATGLSFELTGLEILIHRL